MKRFGSILAAALALVGQAPVDRPSVTIRGRTYTPASILARNMGSVEDQETAFPPHKIIGNIYYVGTRTLSSFLVTTPDGHILIDTTYERNAPVIQKSIESLGFKISDVKIILGNHAHGDHHGGATLVAHLTAGHTRGATTFTTKVTEAAKTYDVVFFTSLRAPAMITSAIAREFDRTFPLIRAFPCDVPLGDHPAEYEMRAKYEKLSSGGGPNPFVDKANCFAEADIQEAMYRAVT